MRTATSPAAIGGEGGTGLVGRSVPKSGASGAALAARLLSARCPQQRQPFLEQFFELRNGPTFEQHVPVGANSLHVLVFRVGSVHQPGLHAATALPYRRDICLDREG